MQQATSFEIASSEEGKVSFKMEGKRGEEIFSLTYPGVLKFDLLTWDHRAGDFQCVSEKKRIFLILEFRPSDEIVRVKISDKEGRSLARTISYHELIEKIKAADPASGV